MEAHEAAFTFMKGAISVEIPFFQRPYVWNEENWQELIDDLFDDGSSHFLGSIILKSIPTPSGQQPRWSLIDGQQRLTTLSILLRACYDTLPLDSYSSDDQTKIKSDRADMLTYKTKSIGGETKLKINHSRVDSPEFTKVIMGDAVDSLDKILLASEAKKGKAPSHGILQCYKFFRNSLDAAKAEELWNLLLNENAKILVKIDLSVDENEQAIFDTVNSAGVRLTCADTIKNSLFQSLMEDAHTKEENAEIVQFYSSTWEEAFAKDADAIDYWATIRPLGRISRDNLEILLHCVALIEGIYDPDSHKMSDLPQIYKQHIKSLTNKEVRGFIQRACGYAKTFRRFFYTFDASTSFEYNQPVKRLFHILEVCDISTLYAYILKILKGYEDIDEGSMPDALLDKLRDLESIALRYTVCKATTKNFNKNCAELITGKITTSDLLNIPDVDDNALTASLRCIGNKHARLVIFWTELKRRADDKMCAEKELKYVYTLEHVMPQKWGTHWPITNPQAVNAADGSPITDQEEAESARGAAVYEIGNMALLNHSLNASLRNYDITRKMEGEGRKSGIRKYGALLSTKDIIDVLDEGNAWNERSIRERTEDITNQVLAIW